MRFFDDFFHAWPHKMITIAPKPTKAYTSFQCHLNFLPKLRVYFDTQLNHKIT